MSTAARSAPSPLPPAGAAIVPGESEAEVTGEAPVERKPGRPWLTALAFLAAVAAPIINAAGAIHRGWVAYGDEAIIVTRAYDVGTRLTPLIGMPSTFSDVSRYNPSQAGPLQFWALAPFVRVLGGSAGVLYGTAAINAAAVGVVGWVLWRRAGRAAALLGMGACLYATLYVVSPTFSYEPVNSIAPLLPLTATLVLAWAVADGELAWLPLLVLFGSFAAQCDLEFVGVVLIVGVWSLIAAAVRARRTGPGASMGAHRGAFIGWSVVLLLACWSGPLYDAARHHGGNLRTIVDAFFAPANLLGLHGIDRALGTTLDLPPYLLLSSTATHWTRGLDATAAVALVALPVLWLACRRLGARTGHTLVVAAAVALVAAAANGYRLPSETFQPGHTVFVRGVGVFVWLAIAVAAVEVLRRVPWPRLARAGAALVIVAVLAEPAWATFLLLARGIHRGGARFALAAIVILGALAAAALAAAPDRTVSRLSSPWRARLRVWRQALPTRIATSAAVLLVGVLAASVAWFPSLHSSYRGWTYEATPALTSQVMAQLPRPSQAPEAFLVTSGGGEPYFDVDKALIAQLRQRHVPVLTGSYLDSTYGAGRSYPTHSSNARGEVLLLPDYATELPPGAKRIAQWAPPGWSTQQITELRQAVVSYVSSHGPLRLDAAGVQRVDETLAFTVPGTDGSGRPDPSVYAQDPSLLLSHPGALTALYQSGWVASPALPPDLRARINALNQDGMAIEVWYVPGPLAAGAGTRN